MRSGCEIARLDCPVIITVSADGGHAGNWPPHAFRLSTVSYFPMEAGIVGLPNVGKSTLFNALTAAGIASENYPFCTIEPNVGAVAIPDDRLATINRFIETQKIIPAIMQLVDIAGLVRGASQGEGLGNQFLANIRNVDAILHVVRCFADADVVHVEGAVDPIRDIETIDTELMLADLQAVEGMLQKAQRTARTGDKDAKARVEMLTACEARLAAGNPVRGLTLDAPAGGEDSQRAATDDRQARALRRQRRRVRPRRQRAARAKRSASGPRPRAGRSSPCVRGSKPRSPSSTKPTAPKCSQSVGLKEPALAVLARAAYRAARLPKLFHRRAEGNPRLDDSRSARPARRRPA